MNWTNLFLELSQILIAITLLFVIRWMKAIHEWQEEQDLALFRIRTELHMSTLKARVDRAEYEREAGK